MKNNRTETIVCPKHGVPLVRKKVLYGLPDPECDLSGYILAGCCIPPNPERYMYECPIEREIYYLDSMGAPIKYEYD